MSGRVIIDCEAREIIYLVVSARLCACAAKGNYPQIWSIGWSLQVQRFVCVFVLRGRLMIILRTLSTGFQFMDDLFFCTDFWIPALLKFGWVRTRACSNWKVGTMTSSTISGSQFTTLLWLCSPNLEQFNLLKFGLVVFYEIISRNILEGPKIVNSISH